MVEVNDPSMQLYVRGRDDSCVDTVPRRDPAMVKFGYRCALIRYEPHLTARENEAKAEQLYRKYPS